MDKTLETIALEVIAELRRQREPGVAPFEYRSDAVIVASALIRVRKQAVASEREAIRLDIDELQDELAELRLRIKDEGRVEKCLDNTGEILSRIRARLDAR